MKMSQPVVIGVLSFVTVTALVCVIIVSQQHYGIEDTEEDPILVISEQEDASFADNVTSSTSRILEILRVPNSTIETVVPTSPYSTPSIPLLSTLQSLPSLPPLTRNEEGTLFYDIYKIRQDNTTSMQRDTVKETTDLSVFETNIRFIGGLLTNFALTGDVMFRDKAEQIAEKLLPAFQTQTGIPHSLINIKTGASKNYGWASGGCSILSEIGTLHLEFSYLSDVTGNPVYRAKVDHIRRVIQSMDKPRGLYPNYINPKTGKWGQHHMSMGGLGDSFYEYLLKAWLQSGREDQEARQMYDDAIHYVLQHMLKVSPGGLTYISDMKFDRLEHKMDHLACFSGGMIGLGAHTLKNDLSKRYMGIAEAITNTCHESYDRTATKLGPEAFRFTEAIEAKALKSSEKYYILRPEALEKHCRVAGGYTGLKNVYLDDPPKDDVQQSFFLAETLKYLYLLFSDDSLMSLDEWVYNTEAHPLPIKGVNPLYRELV
ncbi:Mannosyl-oligosaccharide alpha-1 [Blattella germanica]|nr:Mannosyl-oligosaccharide alpha-1 [Blattella germanica]